MTDVLSKAQLTAEERRQRRMAKILENSESRMSRILSNGGDENGKRHAPAMEGGECYSIQNDSSAVATPTTFGNIPLPSPESQTPTVQNPTPPPPAPRIIDVPIVAVFLGVLARFVMLFTGPINIGILWTVLYTTIVVKFSTAGLDSSTKNEISVILGALSSEPFFKKIINAGFYFLEFVKTTVSFVASFLITHLVFEMYDLSSNYKIVF